MFQAIVFLPLLGAILAGVIALVGARSRFPGEAPPPGAEDDATGAPVHHHSAHVSGGGVIHHDSHEPGDGHGHDDHGHGPVEPAAAGSRTAEAEESAPDIILADYHLDGETGLEAIERLRRRHGGDIPAVLITADRSNEVRAQAAAIDVPVIRKPVKPAALRAAITRLRGTVSAAAE